MMILFFLLLFIFIVMVFVMNVLMLWMISRRQEIGTQVALGLTPFQSSAIFLAEMMAVTATSWLASLVLGGAFLLFFRSIDVPGIFIFPNGILSVSFSFWHFLVTLFLLLLTTFLACILPLSSLKKARVVDLLKEAS